MGDFFKRIRLYAAIFFSRETPWSPKLLLMAGLIYLVYPFDIITDYIPFLGLLDDLTIASLLIALAIRLVPEKVINSISKKQSFH